MSQIQKKKKGIEIIYQLAEAPPEDIKRALDKAFDVLFENVLKNYQPNNKQNEK